MDAREWVAFAAKQTLAADEEAAAAVAGLAPARLSMATQCAPAAATRSTLRAFGDAILKQHLIAQRWAIEISS